VVDDKTMGAVRLTGILDEPDGADSLVLIVHGYGSDAHSPHCAAMARAARLAGAASLRLSLRGADLSGEDIYHGGLTDDLRGALRSVELRRYSKVFLAGYSVGGQIALRAALDHIDDRIRSVAAICAPLDLAAGADEFDRPSRWVYRSHVFASLNRVYAATATRRPLANAVEVVRRARTTRERDELTVVPRFAFRSADDYYRRVQVADELHRLDVPSLLVVSQNDPMVPMHTLRGAIDSASSALSVACVNTGGHMFFPRSLDLGQAGQPGLERQVTRWLLNNQ
jgi:predicted alpha/beta-fold hydrolase